MVEQLAKNANERLSHSYPFLHFNIPDYNAETHFLRSVTNSRVCRILNFVQTQVPVRKESNPSETQVDVNHEQLGKMAPGHRNLMHTDSLIAKKRKFKLVL